MAQKVLFFFKNKKSNTCERSMFTGTATVVATFAVAGSEKA